MIKKVWFWISNQGVEDHLADENALTILLNRMGAVSLVSLSSFSVFLYYSDIYLIFPIITFLISILYGNTIVLNSFGKIYWARINCSTGTLLWVCIYYICFHGFFSQSLSVGATIIVNFVAFAKRPRLMISLNVFHIVLYIAAISYSIVNPPLLQLMDYPLAAIMGFLVSLGWMSTVLFIFYNQNEKLIFQLKAKNKELQSTTDELERFNYIASHDLKTPLRTVNSFIGLIERDIKKGKFDNLEDRLNFVKSGAQQMNFIIEDILELSLVKRLDKSKRKRLHLNTILEQAKMNLATDIAEKRAFIVAKDLHHFHGNEVEFILLFQNLIQNGIKYNNSKTPTISISCSQNEEQIFLHFKDNGIGIAPEFHQLIFQFFKRLHTIDKYEGTGMGLALCNRIVENYNGTITLQSEEGKGSVFSIKLPLEQPMQKMNKGTQRSNNGKDQLGLMEPS